MALKRDLVKYVRDKAKSQYHKGDKCEICGSSDKLDFHHYNSMTMMLDRWLAKNKYNPRTPEEIMDIRDRFITEHYEEVYNATVTLCHPHHVKLHGVYGKRPSLATANKQPNWVEKQRLKYEMA
jgi:hypothetical protein